jgi:nucleoid-associated protein YgaU
MASLQQGKGILAFLGAVAIAGAVGAYGVASWNSREARLALPDLAGTAPQPVSQRQAALPAAEPPASKPAPEKPATAAEAPVPSFDVVRVEPNGESVIAGRSAPGATIEMLRNGHVHARAAADHAGLFAFVPPALPAGSHQVALQSIAPDGTRQRSKQNVTIIIAEGRNTRPLVALSAPDAPTVLLSNPEVPEQKTAEAPAQPAASQPQQQASAQPATAQPQAQATPRPEVRIVAVDSEQGGRLFVSGQGAPGASVRLYLNETFIAPGQIGGDGKVSFAIGRGVRPGDYQVRVDDVDPVSGAVKSRAEVAFNVPAPAVVAAAPPAALPSAPVPSAIPQPPTTGAATTSQPGTAAPANPVNPQFASASPDGPSTINIPDVNTAIVSRGDSLWRISQRIYGDGYRFTMIYGANQKQIRDPNLIYPGQVFVLPTNPPANPSKTQ